MPTIELQIPKLGAKVEGTKENDSLTRNDRKPKGGPNRSNPDIRVEDVDAQGPKRSQSDRNPEITPKTKKAQAFQPEGDLSPGSSRRKSTTGDGSNVPNARGASQEETFTSKDGKDTSLRRSRSTPNTKGSSQGKNQEDPKVKQQEISSSLQSAGEARRRSLGSSARPPRVASDPRKLSLDAVPKETDAVKLAEPLIKDRPDKIRKQSEGSTKPSPAQTDPDNLFRNLFDAHRGPDEPAR